MVKDADEEYNTINSLSSKIKKIKNYKNYFLLNNIEICNPLKITDDDLVNYTSCKIFDKLEGTPTNHVLLNLKLYSVLIFGISVIGCIYDLFFCI